MDKNNRTVLAIDFGASNGRAVVVNDDGYRIKMKEIYRFPNEPVQLGDTLYWDFLRLFYEVKQSLIAAKRYNVRSLSVDGWGVDYGLLDDNGSLIGNPVHYRDLRTQQTVEQCAKKMPLSEIYSKTGNQILNINTLFQIVAQMEQMPYLTNCTHQFLFIPDLIQYMLCGVAVTDKTIASTSQMFDQKEGCWSDYIVEKFAIPKSWLPKVVDSGTVLSEIRRDICREIKIEPMQVIAGAGHDTQCAVAAVPAEGNNIFFISCGTWSLVGVERKEVTISNTSQKLGLTNEQGICGTSNLMKNMTGLWLIQESRRAWAKQGLKYSYKQLEEMAKYAKPFEMMIDPDEPDFSYVGDVPQRIKEYCIRTDQRVPEDVGQIVRCIDESIALKYRMIMEEVSVCTNESFPVIHMIGGGVLSRLLCQMTANATGCKVIAGPVEGTVLGNAGVQLMAHGFIHDLDYLRKEILNSNELIIYEPQDYEKWNQAYQRFKKLLKYREG